MGVGGGGVRHGKAVRVDNGRPVKALAGSKGACVDKSLGTDVCMCCVGKTHRRPGCACGWRCHPTARSGVPKPRASGQTALCCRHEIRARCRSVASCARCCARCCEGSGEHCEAAGQALSPTSCQREKRPARWRFPPGDSAVASPLAWPCGAPWTAESPAPTRCGLATVSTRHRRRPSPSGGGDLPPYAPIRHPPCRLRGSASRCGCTRWRSVQSVC